LAVSLLPCIRAALYQGWKTKDEPGYVGLLAAGIITGIVTTGWALLIVAKIYKA